MIDDSDEIMKYVLKPIKNSETSSCLMMTASWPKANLHCFAFTLVVVKSTIFSPRVKNASRCTN
jgi:hypothetical protein